MAKSVQTAMKTFMGRAPALGANDQIENLAFLPRVQVKTANYTVVSADSGSIFTTTGATAAVNFTLPAIADGPFIFWFINGADQNMTVTSGTADTLVAFNDLTADSVAFSTASEKIAGAIMVVCDGTTIFAVPFGVSHRQTATIAT